MTNEARMAGYPVLVRALDPAVLFRRRSERGFVLRLPALHLHEGKPFTFRGDEIDITYRGVIAAWHDATILEAVES